MEIIQKVVVLCTELLWIESIPLFWAGIGFTFTPNLLATWAAYIIRITAEIAFFRLVGYGLREYIVNKLLPKQYLEKIRTKRPKRRPRRRLKVMAFLKRLGYVGLFMAGLIPFPVLGMCGPIIYNLRQRHAPWYRFDNWAYVCLMAGGYVKMTLCVWGAYNETVRHFLKIIHFM